MSNGKDIQTLRVSETLKVFKRPSGENKSPTKVGL
jgi:hypothetical protein